MKHGIHVTAEAVGAAAALGGASIRAAIAARGSATIVLATGASQFAMLDQLCRVETLDWSRVAVFHLDEYIGFSAQQPASFRCRKSPGRDGAARQPIASSSGLLPSCNRHLPKNDEGGGLA